MADRGVRVARIGFAVTAWLLLACLLLQLFFVGIDLFEVPGAPEGLHRSFAYAYGWLTPGLVLLGAAGRQSRWQQRAAIGLLVLFAVQTFLPLLAEEMAWAAAIHGANAGVLLGLTFAVARSATPAARITAKGGD